MRRLHRFLAALSILSLATFSLATAARAYDVTPRDEFFVDGGDHTRLAFLHDEVGKTTGLVLNPGPWQITGQRTDEPG